MYLLQFVHDIGHILWSVSIVP